MNTIVIEAKQCPNCGRLMAGGPLAGLCPACLLAQGSDTQAGGAKTPFAPPPLEETRKLFPQLEIESLLGAGGMGAVYKARQPALDRWVALKVLPAENSSGVNFAERFNREARALARLNHPNIVTVHEFGQAGALHFFIMEFVDGTNLRQLEQAGRLSSRETLQIIPQICDALQYAHDEGVVHRDIKPENVLLDRKGRVKIADFGLAKIMGQNPDAHRLTMEGQVMGTPHYMAPEQMEKPLTVDHRADIYALGVVFYEMLTGDLPLGKFSPPSRKVQIDLRLDDVVLRALENDPQLRYQKASEVKSQLDTIANTSAPSGQATSAGDERPLYWAGFPIVIERGTERRVNRKERLRAWAIILGLLTIVFAFGSAFTGHSVLGWFGLQGWPSLVMRAVLAALIVAWGVQLALNQPRNAPGAAILKPALPWWRSARVVVLSILLLALTWTIFQASTSLPGLIKRRGIPTVTQSEASAEKWSPATVPGVPPDLNAIDTEAKTLMEAGRYEDALQRHIWLHNHSTEINPAYSAVRRSYYLSSWTELARRYPRAKAALIETRDAKALKCDTGVGYSDLFADVVAINHYIQDDSATCELFRRISKSKRDPQLAAQCIHYAKAALLKSRERELYLRYIGDVQAEFNRMVDAWNRAASTANAQRTADEQFVNDSRALVDMLIAADRGNEAEQIRSQALALVGPDAGLRAKLNTVHSNAPTAAIAQNIAELPSVVVETHPAAGDQSVTPGVTEIRARFSKKMTDDSWSWSSAWENSVPEFIGRPRYEADGKTCVVTAKLQPGTTYGFWLNSEKFQNFKDTAGRPTIPYLLVFKTKD